MARNPPQPCYCGSDRPFNGCCRPLQEGLNAAMARIEVGDHDGADAALATLEQEAGESAEIEAARARVLLARGKLDEALDLTDSILDSVGPQTTAMWIQAEVDVLHGELEMAADTVLHALEHTPPAHPRRRAQMAVRAGELWLDIGNPLAARRCLERAAGFDPTYRPPVDLLEQKLMGDVSLPALFRSEWVSDPTLQGATLAVREKSHRRDVERLEKEFHAALREDDLPMALDLLESLERIVPGLVSVSLARATVALWEGRLAEGLRSLRQVEVGAGPKTTQGGQVREAADWLVAAWNERQRRLWSLRSPTTDEQVKRQDQLPVTFTPTGGRVVGGPVSGLFPGDGFPLRYERRLGEHLAEGHSELILLEARLTLVRPEGDGPGFVLSGEGLAALYHWLDRSARRQGLLTPGEEIHPQGPLDPEVIIEGAADWAPTPAPSKSAAGGPTTVVLEVQIGEGPELTPAAREREQHRQEVEDDLWGLSPSELVRRLEKNLPESDRPLFRRLINDDPEVPGVDPGGLLQRADVTLLTGLEILIIDPEMHGPRAWMRGAVPGRLARWLTKSPHRRLLDALMLAMSVHVTSDGIVPGWEVFQEALHAVGDAVGPTLCRFVGSQNPDCSLLEVAFVARALRPWNSRDDVQSVLDDLFREAIEDGHFAALRHLVACLGGLPDAEVREWLTEWLQGRTFGPEALRRIREGLDEIGVSMDLAAHSLAVVGPGIPESAPRGIQTAATNPDESPPGLLAADDPSHGTGDRPSRMRRSRRHGRAAEAEPPRARPAVARPDGVAGPQLRVLRGGRPGRDEACACGSGKPFRRCCGRD